jgi:hypothetical protein
MASLRDNIDRFYTHVDPDYICIGGKCLGHKF